MNVCRDDDVFAMVSEFEVDPRKQQVLIEEVASQVDAHFRRYDGFLSASYHASENGQRVLNYAQWRSREALHASFRAEGREDMRVEMDRIFRRCGARIVRVDFFCVARVVDNH